MLQILQYGNLMYTVLYNDSGLMFDASKFICKYYNGTI